MDSKLKQLMKELGDTINSTLSESEPIADVITRIKQEGYDVFLVLEATIGFNKREDSLALPQPEVDDSATRDPELTVNAQDVRFLRSLRISFDDSPPDRQRNA